MRPKACPLSGNWLRDKSRYISIQGMNDILEVGSDDESEIDEVFWQCKYGRIMSIPGKNFHYLELNYDGPGTVSNDIFNHVVAALYDAGTPADVELYMNTFTIKGFPSPWSVMNLIGAVIEGALPEYRSHWREARKWKRA